DDVLLPVDEPQEAVLADLHEVAREHAAVLERRRRRLRLIHIAAHHRGRGVPELTRFALLCSRPVFAQDLKARPGRETAVADRAGIGGHEAGRAVDAGRAALGAAREVHELAAAVVAEML